VESFSGKVAVIYLAVIQTLLLIFLVFKEFQSFKGEKLLLDLVDSDKSLASKNPELPTKTIYVSSKSSSFFITTRG
jgi:hypothetical protein